MMYINVPSNSTIAQPHGELKYGSPILRYCVMNPLNHPFSSRAMIKSIMQVKANKLKTEIVTLKFLGN